MVVPLFFRSMAMLIALAAAMQAQNCPVTVNPPSVGIAETGGTFILSIAADPGCSWIVNTSVPWIAATPASGSGSAVVQFAVGQNPGTTRFAFLLIGNQGIVVTQPGVGATACWFVLNPSTLTVPPVGQTGVAAITAGAANCTWNVLSHARWIQVFPLSGTSSALVQYTIFPNFSTSQRNGIVNIGAQAFTVTQLPATVTAEERFVSMMYFNFFGRFPSGQELTLHLNSLAAGLSRTDLVLSFFNTPEFNLGGRFIAGLYVGVLNRDAEFDGWLFQRNALATGRANQSQLVMNFVNSQEFGLRFGSPTSEEFVRLMYRNILLREPSNNEVAFQVAALNAGVTRVQLAENFLNSAEFRSGTGPRLTAFLLYAVLLGRDASAGDLTSRIAQLQSGIPVRTLLDQFINSAEFLAQLQ